MRVRSVATKVELPELLDASTPDFDDGNSPLARNYHDTKNSSGDENFHRTRTLIVIRIAYVSYKNHETKTCEPFA